MIVPQKSVAKKKPSTFSKYLNSSTATGNGSPSGHSGAGRSGGGGWEEEEEEVYGRVELDMFFTAAKVKY